MSPEAQRIAIAEACPKTFRCCRCREVAKLIKYAAPFCSDACAESASDYTLDDGQRSIPDYLGDLNAMHEAEDLLNAEQCAEYARRLMKHHPTYCTSVLAKGAEEEDIANETFDIIHATAAQRAEAFLRTVGKWVESAPAQTGGET